MANDGDDISLAALEYARYGWQVVPIKPRDKRPFLDDWPARATSDAAVVVEFWEQTPEANVGILLGERSGIIDFEGDGPDAEKTLLAVFGGEPPITPTYKSSRGKHRLFHFRDDLPGQGKNHFKVGDLEIRTGYGGMAAQSVFPPSHHPDGGRYEWLVPPTDCPPAVISDAVQAWLWNWFDEPTEALQENKRARRDWEKVAAGTVEGERNETLASFAGKLFSDLADPFDNGAVGRLFRLMQAWNERNRPPMPDDEVKKTFESILSRHRQKTASLNANEHFEKDKPTTAPDDWRLEIVESRPRKYRLYSPLWAEQTLHGYIEIHSGHLQWPAKIRQEALEQADVWIDPTRFDRRWLGGKGVESLGRQLVQSAEHIAAGPEERRDVVVAEAVLQCLEHARVAVDNNGPDHRGRPVRMEDGAIWFQVGAVLEDVGYTLSKIKHGEVVEVLKNAGARNDVVWLGGRSKRFKVLDREGLRSLRMAAEIAEHVEKT
jgi:hypothetical protein